MPTQARTIEDTILGEAVSGTPQERYADMLGIASVISNRSSLYGITPETVVSQTGFDAYGKALPKGVEEHRSLASRAWNHVQTIGPVTSATYYSTPEAQKNLPAGLEAIDKTTGHVFHVDPQARPIRVGKTAVAAVKEAVAALPGRVSEAVQNTVQSVRSGVEALTGNVREQFNLGPNRPNKPLDTYRTELARTVSNVAPGSTINHASGMGNYGSHRHRGGLASDFDVIGPTGEPMSWDLDQPGNPAQDIAMSFAAANPQAGIGFGPGYMSPGRMHLDLAGPAAVWGAGGKKVNASPAFRQNVENARTLGRFADQASMNRPDMAPGHLPGAAPEIERRDLGPAAPNPANTPPDVSRNPFDTQKAQKQSTFDSMVAGMDSPVYGPGQVAPASQPAQVSRNPFDVQKSAPQAPTTAPQAPTTADLANAYGQMATMGQVGIANLSGAPLAAPQKPSLEQVAAVSLPGTPAPALTAPKTIKTQTIAAPQKQATPQQAPQQTIGAFPEAPEPFTAPKSKMSPQLKQRATAALLGGLVGGLPGAALGGLLGPSLSKANPFGGLGGMFGNAPSPTKSNYGSGVAAMSDILGGGGTAGSTAHSRSTPGYSVTNLGNGMVAKTNQYGVTSYEYTGPTTSLFGGGGMFGGGGFGSGRDASRSEADRGGRGVSAGGKGLW